MLVLQYYNDKKMGRLFFHREMIGEASGPRSKVARALGVKKPKWVETDWGWQASFQLVPYVRRRKP